MSAVRLFVAVAIVGCGLAWLMVGKSRNDTQSRLQAELNESLMVRNAVIDYCVAAKGNDRTRLMALVSWTPEYYWSRTSNSIATEELGNLNAQAKAAVAEGNSDFERLFYKGVTEKKPLIWKDLEIPTADELSARVNGDFAIVRGLMRSQNYSTREDFLLVKTDGTWRVFDVRLSHNNQTFPFVNEAAFTERLPRP